MRSLEWDVRDASSVLVPVKLLLSQISWAAKGLDMLKIPPSLPLPPSQVKTQLVVCLNTIFRQLSSRPFTPYSAYVIPERFNPLFDHFTDSFFERTLGREVGLRVCSFSSPHDTSTVSTEDGPSEAAGDEKDGREDVGGGRGNEGVGVGAGEAKYYLEFVLRHPLYIYARMAEVVLAPTLIDETRR